MQMPAGEGSTVPILLHPGEARGRQRDGEMDFEQGSQHHWGRKPAFSVQRMLFRRPRQVQEAEGAAGLKQTLPARLVCLQQRAAPARDRAGRGDGKRHAAWLSSPALGWFPGEAAPPLQSQSNAAASTRRPAPPRC